MVRPDEVKLFWDGKTDDPKYKLTTDWGALDAYHAPSRNGKDAFLRSLLPTGRSIRWSLRGTISWFLAALGARRGLTFLERQPEVDGSKLGVYGHSWAGN